jgi:hypothetical protein
MLDRILPSVSNFFSASYQNITKKDVVEIMKESIS